MPQDIEASSFPDGPVEDDEAAFTLDDDGNMTLRKEGGDGKVPGTKRTGRRDTRGGKGKKRGAVKATRVARKARTRASRRSRGGA